MALYNQHFKHITGAAWTQDCFATAWVWQFFKAWSAKQRPQCCKNTYITSRTYYRKHHWHSKYYSL